MTLRELKFLITICLVSTLLTGCGFFKMLFGNGEGYPGGRPDVDIVLENDQQKPVPTQGETTAKEIFHYFEPNHTCEFHGEVYRSAVKGVIEIVGDRFYLYGDSCSTTMETGHVQDLERFGDIIGFGEGIYQRVR